jgi:hypothetical protein
MILTSHAIVGASLANVLPNNPVVGFGLAFISHYAIDMIPHTDYDISNFLQHETKTIKSILRNAGAALHLLFIVADFIFAILLCILFFVRDGKSLTITLMGITGGVLPDFLQFLYFKYKKQPWIFFQRIHDKFHFTKELRNQEFWGIFFQFALPVCFLTIYFLVKRLI